MAPTVSTPTSLAPVSESLSVWRGTEAAGLESVLDEVFVLKQGAECSVDGRALGCVSDFSLSGTAFTGTGACGALSCCVPCKRPGCCRLRENEPRPCSLASWHVPAPTSLSLSVLVGLLTHSLTLPWPQPLVQLSVGLAGGHVGAVCPSLRV